MAATETTTATPKASETRQARWGDQLRRCRMTVHLRQVDLARKVGVSADAVRAWEAGRRGMSLVMRQRVCAELGIPPYLLDANRRSLTPGPRRRQDHPAY